MKVYVIERGDYSDRHVVGVVEDEEEAKKIVKSLQHSSKYDIYRHDDSATYTEFDTKHFQTKLLCFHVEEVFDSEWTAEYDDYGIYEACKENAMLYDSSYVIYANSAKQAIKIAQDMKAEQKAREAGIAYYFEH